MVQLVGVFDRGIEPLIDPIGGEDDRHSIVERGNEFVRGCGDDGARLQNRTIGSGPTVPQSSQAEWGIVLPREENWLFRFGCDLSPFVEAVRHDEASLPAERISEGRFLGECFAPCVDRAESDLRVFRP